MSYLVLARKSRPSRFEEVVGQQPVVRTLQNALEKNRVAHAMIFSGVRGVGKTTLARIMAKALNCEKGAPGAEPCDQCRSCREIGSGTSVDLVEIDGASNRGIQEIRELKENIRFMPSGSRFKVIIIDEVHMLTTEAFNALLKTLEEPPAHVYFMFATTELHRVPVTILSRCQRYELKRVPAGELADHFSRIAEAEGVQMDASALNLVVREAGGSVRDGLSLLDQVFSYCGDTVTAREVTEMLGLVSQESVAAIGTALLERDIDAALSRLAGMYEFGLDLKRFINDLLSWFRGLVICSVSSRPEQHLDLPGEILAAMREKAAGYTTAELTLIFNVLMENLEKAGYASHPRYVVEMAFIKAVHAADVVPVTRLIGRLDELLGDVSQPAGPTKKKVSGEADPAIERAALYPENSAVAETPGSEKRAVSPDEPPARERSEAGSASAEEKRRTPASESPVDPVPGIREKTSSPGSEAAQEKIEAADEKPKEEKKGDDDAALTKKVRKEWDGFIDYVRDRKVWMASALQQSSAVRVEGDLLLIEYDDGTRCGLLRNRENVTLLTEFALDFFQENFRIRFVLPDVNQCEIDPVNGKTPQQERQALANDALVLTAVDIFNGEVGDIRVGPRFRRSMDEEVSSGDTE
ncbi:MAG: DNA polymerase III subunit gamma/tau [Desulfobulbaceae bacterium]